MQELTVIPVSKISAIASYAISRKKSWFADGTGYNVRENAVKLQQKVSEENRVRHIVIPVRRNARAHTPTHLACVDRALVSGKTTRRDGAKTDVAASIRPEEELS